MLCWHCLCCVLLGFVLPLCLWDCGRWHERCVLRLGPGDLCGVVLGVGLAFVLQEPVLCEFVLGIEWYCVLCVCVLCGIVLL